MRVEEPSLPGRPSIRRRGRIKQLQSADWKEREQTSEAGGECQ